ncbi:hypothetical protein HD554DRAFT_2315326 [Boletus coccyginus]|nr:hypothetical protein HD554DRAFT_2315326 [Boletus coccyginus]
MTGGIGPGEYVIFNKHLGPDGIRLAVTFKQAGSPLPVQESNGKADQTWIVRGDPGGPQTISPVDNINLQVSPLHGVYAVAKQDHYSWRIKGNLEEVVIYEDDPSSSSVWTLPDAVPGAPVILNPLDLESQTQKWQFFPVD